MSEIINDVSNEGTVLCLVDNSRFDYGVHLRKVFLQEALNVEKNEGGKEIILMSADSVIRGEPVLINKNNVNKLKDTGIPIFSESNDFVLCLKHALNSSVMKDKNLGTVIYFSDSPEQIPTKAEFEEYLNKGVNIYFTTTSGHTIDLNVQDAAISNKRKNRM
jgi:hypothetical protein